MKIFGLEFTTKKELKAKNKELTKEVGFLEEEVEELNWLMDEILEDFPFHLGQKVYDVALKNAKGRYTKVNPVYEYCTITEVTVDEKNYFNLVSRYRRNDVFLEETDAKEYLESVCTRKED
jgi:hypothetical protein